MHSAEVYLRLCPMYIVVCSLPYARGGPDGCQRFQSQKSHGEPCKGAQAPRVGEMRLQNTSSNADYPGMLPGLRHLDKIKVELANQLYSQVTWIAIFCISLGLLMSIEHLAASLYWATCLLCLLQCGLSFLLPWWAASQAYAVLGLPGSQKVFAQLSLFCDGGHCRKSWTLALQSEEFLRKTSFMPKCLCTWQKCSVASVFSCWAK